MGEGEMGPGPPLDWRRALHDPVGRRRIIRTELPVNVGPDTGAGPEVGSSWRGAPPGAQPQTLKPPTSILKTLLLHQPLFLVLRQPVVELAEADPQLGCGGVAVALVLFQGGEDRLALDV